MKKNRINGQIILEILSFLMYGGLVVYALLSGKYMRFVTPRLRIYIWISVLVMGIWSAVNIYFLFYYRHRQRSMHTFIVLIPALCMVFMPTNIEAQDVSNGLVSMGQISSTSSGSTSSKVSSTSSLGTDTSSDSSQKLVDQSATFDTGTNTSDISSSSSSNVSSTQEGQTQVSSSNGTDESGTTDSDNTVSTSESDDSDTYVSEDLYYTPITLHGYDEANKTITVSDDEFYGWMNEIFMNIDEFLGYSVTVNGYVFKDDDYFDSDEFVPARLLMWCCAADLSPTGIICKYDQASTLEADSWVKITGTVVDGTYNDVEQPKLQVTKVEQGTEIDDYVYTY